MKKLRIAVAFLLLLGVFGLLRHAVRPGWQKELEASPTLIVYSLEPHRDLLPAKLQKSGRWLNHAESYILDETVVSSPEDKKLIIEAVRASFSSDLRPSSSNFHARCAVGTPDAHTLISLCYECGIGNIFNDKSIMSDEEGNFISINLTGKPLIDALLSKYRLRVSHSNEK